MGESMMERIVKLPPDLKQEALAKLDPEIVNWQWNLWGSLKAIGIFGFTLQVVVREKPAPRLNGCVNKQNIQTLVNDDLH